MLATLLIAVGLTWAGPTTVAPPREPMTIVGGQAVQTCGWPTTVYTGGCTGTLVHPKAISTAQHCGAPSSVQFGESAGAGPTVGVLGCVGDGSQDAMLCELAEAVTELPVTPVLFGCEVDMHLQPGADVIMAGFGQTSYGVGGGTKLWAPQTIASVESGRVIVGNAGDGVSPCPGDSGGPVFIQVGDDGWRVIGTVLGGTTGTPCNSAADFQRLDTVVANFEAQTDLDITPCFDAQTGAWDPGPECGGFFAGDHTGAGQWSSWCADAPRSAASDACGPAFGDGGDPGDEGDSDGSADAGADGEDGAGTGGGGDDGSGSEASDPDAGDPDGAGTGGDDDEATGTGVATVGALPPGWGTGDGEVGCRAGGRPPVVAWTLALLALAGIRRRRGR